MAGDQLNLRVGEAVLRQVGKHLMAEQVGMDMVSDPCPIPVLLHNLLYAARSKRRAALRLEQIAIFGVGPQMALEHQAEVGREQDVAILGALALVDENLAAIAIHVLHTDIGQLTDAHGRVEQQLEHNLMLEITAFLGDAEEALEIGLRQKLRQLALCPWLAQAEFLAGLLADIDEIGVTQPFLAGEADDVGDHFGFRFLIWRYEILPLFLFPRL